VKGRLCLSILFCLYHCDSTWW